MSVRSPARSQEETQFPSRSNQEGDLAWKNKNLQLKHVELPAVNKEAVQTSFIYSENYLLLPVSALQG